MNNTNTLLNQLSKIASNPNYDLSYILAQLSKLEEPTIILDSLSDSQIESKLWLVDAVKNFNLGKIFLCAGWVATLLFDRRLNFTQCVNIDVDPNCQLIAKILHKRFLIDNWKFQSVTEDIHNINYSKHKFDFYRADGTTCNVDIIPDTIINTSCEHIDNFKEWFELIPTGKLVILQSNNGFGISGHINCVNNLLEFKNQTPLSVELYSGQKDMPKFTRFMRIGYK
jgi:hypothetical protein